MSPAQPNLPVPPGIAPGGGGGGATGPQGAPGAAGAPGATGPTGTATTSNSPSASSPGATFTLTPANGDTQTIVLTQNITISAAGFPTSSTVQPILLQVIQGGSGGYTVSFSGSWTNLNQVTNNGQVVVSPGLNDKTNLVFQQTTSTPSSGSVTATNPACDVLVQSVSPNYAATYPY